MYLLIQVCREELNKGLCPVLHLQDVGVWLDRPRFGSERFPSPFTSTEVVYEVTGTGVTELPEYGVSP